MFQIQMMTNKAETKKHSTSYRMLKKNIYLDHNSDNIIRVEIDYNDK